MSKVVYEKRNRIGYITLNRPEALNALDDELNDALWEVWADLKTFIPKWEHATMLDVRKNAARGIGVDGSWGPCIH
jgi:enoyl-CoA hydratase